MTARRQPSDWGKGQPGGPGAKRAGRGRAAGQDKWPSFGPVRDWLAYCAQVHQANGTLSLRALAESLDIEFGRVGELMRGDGLPVDEQQARALLEALGAVGSEVDRGVGLYKDARDGRPTWKLPPGYANQVRDIAPGQLLGREDELAELSAWCTRGDEVYVRWEAGPWAGKSALMAWLVLHPPPGTWVISFFVTAARNTQSDSAAYTGELLSQLAAITGGPVPSSASPAQRDQLRRQMLEQAAARAVKAGMRLVLVIDGLDEDCGSLTGSGLPSVAACLPGRPPPGLRVIVAARPDPQLPADVSPGHLLRRCRIRRLDVSPYATDVMRLAQQELDLILATDKDRHGGLGRQILGLVIASGGGLGHSDLEELTDQDTAAIDRLLNGTFGRTIAARADPRTGARTFLFTHDTLHKQATSRLGPHTLQGFTQLLHSWAGAYQHDWPPDTPEYLLYGYPRMLADTGDLDHLVALATDPARHQRMLDATGGDAATIAEITTALTLVSASPRPNLLAALRLAWYRDQLADRNTRIPARLPAVWAALGQPVRAEALAQSIASPGMRAEALAGVAVAVARAGDHDRARALAAAAEQAARSTTEPYEEARALAKVARAAAQAGHHDRARTLATAAEQAARFITEPYDEARFLADLAGAVARAGDHDRAEQIARSNTTPHWQARTLADVAVAVGRAGDHDRARALVAAAEQAARSTTRPDDQARALADVAGAAAQAGDHDRARTLAAAAEQAARSVTEGYEEARALADVAGAAAQAGDHDRARTLATAAEQATQFLTQPHWKAWILSDVAVAVGRAGDHDRARALAAAAEQAARSATEPYDQAGVLADVAGAAARAGDYDRARALAAAAEQAARSATEPHWQARALGDLAEAVAWAGDHDRARALAAVAQQAARSIASPDRQARALADLAGAVARAGDYDRAEQIARSTNDPDWQSRALTHVAEAAASAGDHDRAKRLSQINLYMS